VLPVEGPRIMVVRGIHHAGGIVSPQVLDSCAQLARVAESDRALLEIGSHLLAVGRRSASGHAVTTTAGGIARVSSSTHLYSD
jgi:hypothetical protein